MILEFKDIVVSNGDKVLIKNTPFKINIGSSYAIIGRNGTGKTAFLKTIYKFFLLKDTATKNWTAEFLIADLVVNNKKINVYELLTMHLGTEEKWIKKVNNDFRDWNIKKFLYTNLVDLSGGQFKLIYFFIKLNKQPDLLIIDEPEANIDKKNIDLLIKKLRIFNKKGGTLLFATHSSKILNDLAIKTFLISNNKIKFLSQNEWTNKRIAEVIHEGGLIDETFDWN